MVWPPHAISRGAQTMLRQPGVWRERAVYSLYIGSVWIKGCYRSAVLNAKLYEWNSLITILISGRHYGMNLWYQSFGRKSWVVRFDVLKQLRQSLAIILNDFIPLNIVKIIMIRNKQEPNQKRKPTGRVYWCYSSNLLKTEKSGSLFKDLPTIIKNGSNSKAAGHQVYDWGGRRSNKNSCLPDAAVCLLQL